MKKYSLILLLFPVLLSGCKSFGQAATDSNNEVNLIKGNWVSDSDSLYSLKIDEYKIIEYYDKKITDTFEYKLLSQSCDEAYSKANKKGDKFLKKYKGNETYCYEIIGLSRSSLSLIYTLNGKINPFTRK